MRPPAAAAAASLCLLLSLAPGCARSRTFTIYAKPADAKLVINGVPRGPGPITQRFEFGGSSDSVRVTALREGYSPKTQRLTADTPRDTVVIELEPLGPKAVVSVEPAAMVRVNGALVKPTPVRQAEITLDPGAPDKTYTVVAEQTGYQREVLTITGKNPPGYYRMTLRPLRGDETSFAQLPPATRPAPTQPQPQAEPTTRAAPPIARADAPMRRTIVIRAEPPVEGAEIYVGNEKRGDKAVELVDHPFQRDPASGKSVPQKVRATAPGYQGGEVTVRFEDGRGEYVVPLGQRRKDVRITTEPPGAVVTLNGRELPRDREGASFDTITFPPFEAPDRPTKLQAVARPADPAAPFEPAQLVIGWDGGNRDYTIKLPPSPVVKVPTLRVVPAWDTRAGWRATAVRVDTVAARDVSEGNGRAAPQPLADLPPGTLVESVIASPDGSQVLYTELLAPEANAAGAALRSRLRLLNSDGTPGPTLPSDGRHFDGMPSFTPDGTEIVFTSDRAGNGLDVWSMKVPVGAGAGAGVGADAGANGGVRQIARGGEKAGLWPMIDASPRPRLFYEEFLKPAARASESRSEVHVIELQADPPTNKALSPGTRPRASPRADAVVFTRVDPATGKRDLYLISDKDGIPLGGTPVNLTRTPDVDECDPAWSRTGGKIAYASDGGTDTTNRRNYDLYVMTLSDPQHPVRITYNGSVDDSPAWDPTGKSLYFRSNRGGKWGVWKTQAP